MSSPKPAWANVDDATSVRQEAAPYRDMSPEQRLVVLAMACRAAMRLLLSREDRHLVMRHVDPLPDSSVHALARLREVRARDRI